MVHYQCWIEVIGMSDLSIYELEDIIWDDFDRSGDHIVPHPSHDHGSEDIYGDSCKKPRLEVTPLQINEGEIYASGSVCKVKDERDPMTLNKEKMEKDSWSHTPEGVFAVSGDADMAKDMPKISNHCPPSQILQLDYLNLFSDDGDDKESSDLLYYGWPDIGNFEDVDRMLSNCDSSFGLDVTGNDDELVWFTSEDPSGGYEEALKMDLQFQCSEPSALTNISQDHEPRESDNKNIRVSSLDESDQQQNKNLGHGSFGYMQTNTYPHPSHDHHPTQSTCVPVMTGIKYENKGLTSPSRKETSSASNKVHSMDISGNLQKQSHTSEKKTESQSDKAPEGSSVSSEFDEISLEATSFRQLQQVMDQLDLRTKLCIRDSLYRLAKSAEQRHNYAGTGGSLMTQGPNKCTGFMDMETDTNPIDRTIAHLLFHRPSDSSNMPIPSPLKPNAKVHGSTMGSLAVAEKQSCQEEAANESDGKMSQ